MKPFTHDSSSTATDRMRRSAILCFLLLLSASVSTFSVVNVYASAQSPGYMTGSASKQDLSANDAVSNESSVVVSSTADDEATNVWDASLSDIGKESEILESEFSVPDPVDLESQEVIAQQIEPSLIKTARAGSRISYPWPSGAMAVDLYQDGRRILAGQVADIGGTVYVPVQRFADLFGYFHTTYTEETEEVLITGTNLSIRVRVGDPYITANGRIFYTGKKVISLGGWIFVPLTSITRALSGKVNIRAGYYEAYVTSGDPTSLALADDVYNETDLYWLSRIISAEARGEPFEGQIAVGNVVLNRVRSQQFPNTVKEVIFDRKYGVQFSPVASGTIYHTPSESAIRAAKICLEGYSLSTRILYFYNPRIATSSWIGQSRPYIMTIGNHKFYG